MKNLPCLLAGALFGASCFASAYAQPPSKSDPSAPKTRAEVKADTLAWLAAGYDPNNWWDYPDNAQRAGRIVAAQRAQEAGAGGAQMRPQ